MSSAISSFSSAFSSSFKGSSAVLWVVGSAVQSLLVAFAINTRKIPKTSLQATSTIKSVLAPSPCIPVAGSLGRPYMVVISYIGVIGMLIAWIFLAKASNGASASPPDPPTPDPGPIDTSFQCQDPASPPHSPIAAAGAPPPPPPGNDTTCGNERRPKRSFWFLRWLFGIILWIFSIILWSVWCIVRVFKWIFVQTIWRPIAIVSFIVSFILLHGAIIPLLVQEISYAYGVTPFLRPYISVPKLLRWLTLWGGAQCLCWIINVVVWVVSFVFGTAIWAVGFTWTICRGICLSSIRSILAVPTGLRRIRKYSHWLWSRWRTFWGDGAWWALGLVFVLSVWMGVELGIFVRPLVPLVVSHILHFHERVFVTRFVRESPAMILQTLSELAQEAAFWGKWIGIPILMVVVGWLNCFPEDGKVVLGIAFFSILIRWIFSSKWAERAARRKLEKRIKMLERRS